MHNLVVDVGNSFVKTAVFSDDKLIYNHTSPTVSTDFIANLINNQKIDNLIVSSVKSEVGFDVEEIAAEVNYIKFSWATKSPIKNKYQTPTTLGLDRLAGVIAATNIYPKKAVLVIDAGTCTTYDEVSATAEYHGGSISPGIKMRFDAMHHFTAKLPLVNFDFDFKSGFGESTENAIKSGATNGSIYEADGFINQFLNNNPAGKIILTGGDSSFFDTKFKNRIFANLILHEPNLVLIGLNTVVNYQHDHK